VTKPVVSAFQGCSFKGLDLARFIIEWKDTREPALAVHRYAKRDGGEVETLGRKPHEAKLTLAFAGPTWRRDWLPIAASIDDDPKGPLVHPVYGRMQAACQGFNSATMNVEQAANLYIVPLGFVEDNVDTRLVAEGQGPAAALARVEATGAALLKKATQAGRPQPNVLRFVTTATVFATATYQAFQRSMVDRALPGQLGKVRDYAAQARAALRAAGGDTSSYEAIALAEELYDACVQLEDAVRAAGPRFVVYTVPALTSLAALAARFYGADGVSRMNEILANNPGRIPNPAAIRAGTQLVMEAPMTSFV
jgi:prophage DNA circulation protein